MLKVLLLPLSLFLNCIPNGALRFLASVLGFVCFSILRFRRKVVLSNLELAFGASKSRSQIAQLAKDNYRHYAMTFMEWMRSILWSQKKFIRETELSWDPIRSQMELGQGGMVLTSHLGNWEFAIQAASARGMPCDIVVKRQNNKFVQNFLDWFRTRYGARVIYESGGMSDVFKSLGEKRFVIFVLDQFMGPPIGLPVKFFGHEAGTAAGLALITEKRRYSLFTAYSERTVEGKLVSHLEKMPEAPPFNPEKIDRLYQKTQWYNDILEKQIRQNPSQWLWLHRRWKPYQGRPRWALNSLVFVLAAASLLGACSTPNPVTPSTGIELPPDPAISMPVYETEAPKLVLDKKEKGSSKQKQKKTAPVGSATAASRFSFVPVEKVPFEQGERLVIDLTWLALPAGQGVLEVRQGTPFQGRPTFHLWGNVLSSKVVDTIYHVDNTIESFIDEQGLIPYKFLLSMFESAQKKETRVSFDHPQAKAFYWSKRISEKWGNQDIDRTDTIVSGTHDMFSGLYYARSIEYELHKKQTLWIYENGQNLNVELLPLSKEIVTTKAGVFQCWKIKVDVRLNNVLKPTGDLFMWLSDDSKKYLVKFDAKLKIGSLMGRLISIKER